MKEFEKWYVENYDIPGTYHYHRGASLCLLRDAWKAALEWVLDMEKEDVYGGDIYNKAYHIPDWGIDEIKKELEDNSGMD